MDRGYRYGTRPWVQVQYHARVYGYETMGTGIGTGQAWDEVMGTGMGTRPWV